MEHPSTRVYYIVYVALLALLAVTLAAAEWNVTRSALFVATAIATVKATLILLYFMHVRYSRPLIWVVAVGGLFWLGILFGLTFSDYLTRTQSRPHQEQSYAPKTNQDERFGAVDG